jgi:TRAP transporter 4TM/12TM fusion protein
LSNTKEKPGRLLKWVIATVAIAMVLYHAFSTQYLLVGAEGHMNIHLSFALVLVFLSGINPARRSWWLLPILAILSVLATAYIHVFMDDLQERIGFPTTADIVIGIILVVVALEATRRSFGPVLPVIAILFIIYAFLGSLLPGPLQAYQFDPKKLLSKLTMLSGIYGVVLGVSANYIFLFIIFGSLLQISGATRFFIEVGSLFGRRFRGGPALAAVTCSSLVGMVTGSPAANVATIGPFTIPLMKKVGYSPTQAAAIEAVASTGGQIMPPVMGAAAFVMSGITGIPYIRICIAAFIPAILYYFSIAAYAQLQALKQNITVSVEKVRLRTLLFSAPLFVLPLATLIILLIRGKSPAYVIFWAIVILVVLALLRRESRPSFSRLIEGLTDGAIQGARIGVVCGMLGLIVAPITLTGLGIKLPAVIEALSHGNLGVLLLITMVVSIILGTGLPTTPTYVLVAILTAPVLTKMGISQLQSHFFAFYFAVLSAVTPPEAMAALISSNIAGASFMKTGWESFKVALGSFMVPFLTVWAPILLFMPEPPLIAALKLSATVLIFLLLQIIICGYYFRLLKVWEYLPFAIATGGLLGYIILGYFIVWVAGIGILIAMTLWHWKTRRKGTNEQR